MTCASVRTSLFCSELKLMISGNAADLRPCTSGLFGSMLASSDALFAAAPLRFAVGLGVGDAAQRRLDRGPHLLLIRASVAAAA